MPLERLSPTALDNFWLRMAGMYGNTWVSQYGAAPHGIGGETWAMALAGITLAQIGDGLRSALACGGDWPPSAPRFRAMCLGIPTLSTVQLALKHRQRPTPFMRLVWQHLDSNRLARADEDKADRLIRDAYDLARTHVMSGGQLPAEPAALIEKKTPERKPATPAVAERHIADIAALLKTEPVKPYTEVDA